MSVWRRIAVAFPVDWTHRRRYRLYTPDEPLGPYYVRWDPCNGTYGEDWRNEHLDANGVLRSDGGSSYHPIRIAQYALEQHSRWLENGDPACRRAFLAQSRWLCEQQQTRAGIPGCYPMPFAWARYGAPEGFLSAMAQGEAISVLLRAAQITGGQAFVDAAIRAAEPFRHPIVDGGVVYTSAEGDLICEEAASEKPSHILNGWIFAAWGLFELQPFVAWARDSFTQTVGTLRKRLPLYDSGKWSYYSLTTGRDGFRKLATLKYHAFHIAQLHVLDSMTHDTLFEDTAKSWEAYLQSPLSRLSVWSNAMGAGLREVAGVP